MLQYYENFLSNEECDILINMIEESNQRSSVVGAGTDTTQISEHRTSHTSNLPANDLVTGIKTKISNLLSLPLDRGEPLQGQVYSPGQYFKPHTDYFESDAYEKHCLSSGNRTHTFMIYLNNVEEGGETNFPELGLSIKPKKGMAISWPDMLNGRNASAFLHEGSEVIKGKKYVITSWWRENTFNSGEDLRVYNELLESRNKENMNTFNETTIPRLTEKGYKVVKLPQEIWEKIQTAYSQVLDKNTEEVFQGKDYFIPGNGVTSTIMPLDYIPELRNEIHTDLLKLHEEFCGEELIPTFLYGIRSYNRYAKLTTHTDRPETHHISGIIIVDKDLKCGCQNKDNSDDWALDIQNHDGEWEKVYAEPGHIILYESLACPHGRNEPFGGTFYRNMFVHYKFKNREYKP